MDRVNLQQTLREMLEEEKCEPIPALEESMALRESLGLDSVDLISLVMRIQQRFRVVLSNEELEKLVSVGDLLNLLQAKLAGVARAA